MSRPPSHPATMGPPTPRRRTRSLWGWGAWVLWFALAAATPAGPAGAETYLTVFGGVASKGDIWQTTGFKAGAFESYLAGVALARTVGRHGEWARWEAEVQAVKHMGMQTHLEGVGLVLLRWRAFPWNSYLSTTAAVGDGLSYCTREPEVEIRRQGRSTRLLNYLLFEITLALPGEERWSLSLRQHHRSGIFGIFDGMHGGSDFWVAGVRRAF